MSSENIKIKGARVHNLKNIDVTIPRDKLVVVTGLSGSGKSSLAFDLCRRAEKICRVAFVICKTVFRSDGQAGR